MTTRIGIPRAHPAGLAQMPPPPTTTGLAGLHVHPKPREALLAVYRDTLAVVERMPAEAAYRQAVERLTRDRQRVVETHQDRAEIERLIGRGQLEQLLVQAVDERALAERMLEWRPWEPLAEQPPSADQWQYFDSTAAAGTSDKRQQ